MSVNDFDQTVPLPTNGEETTPLPVGNDAPEVPQPASASDETATLPSGLVSETRELPVTEDAAPSSAEQSEADAEVSDAPAAPPSESTPHASSGASSTYTSPQAGASTPSTGTPQTSQGDAPTAWTSAASGAARHRLRDFGHRRNLRGVDPKHARTQLEESSVYPHHFRGDALGRRGLGLGLLPRAIALGSCPRRDLGCLPDPCLGSGHYPLVGAHLPRQCAQQGT